MNYLVLQPKGQFCEIRVFSNADAVLDKPIEVWTLQTGKQILFVDMKMSKTLKNLYLHGTYQNGATYAYSFEEMRAVLTDLLGPSDQARYEVMEAEQDYGHRAYNQGRAYFASYFAVEALSSVVRVMWMGVKFVLFMAVIPFIISMLSKRK